MPPKAMHTSTGYADTSDNHALLKFSLASRTFWGGRTALANERLCSPVGARLTVLATAENMFSVDSKCDRRLIQMSVSGGKSGHL